MTQPRTLTGPRAEDVVTISFVAPRALNAAIAKAADASGETREELLIARLATSLGMDGRELRRGLR